jgi:PilZ domain
MGTEAAEQLDLLVSGKRSSPRYITDMPVRIKGVNAEFEAVARDISTGGVLIELRQDTLAGCEDAGLGTVAQLGLVETHFRDNFDVQFSAQGVVMESALVRVSMRPETPASLFLGCQFAHPLSEEQQRKMGLAGGSVGAPAWEDVPELETLGLEADPLRPAYLMILDETEAVAGPRFMGPLTAVGRDLLVARIDGTTCDDVTACLAGRDLRVRVMSGARVVWEIEARMLATRFTDGRRQGAEVAVLPRSAPGRKVRKLMRRRAA